MSFLINNAKAATATAQAGQGDTAFSFIMIAVIFAIFYLLLIRPQNKRAKEHKTLISQLKKGDEVIAVGGVLGKIASLDEHFVKIKVADSVELVVQRHAISAVLPKGTLNAI